MIGVVILGFALTVGVRDQLPPGLGWTYNRDMGQFERPHPARVARGSRPQVGAPWNHHYDLTTDTARVSVVESGGDRSQLRLTAHTENNKWELPLGDQSHFGLYIKRDGQMRPTIVEFQHGECRYTDLNGDGEWDVWLDRREKNVVRQSIWFEGKWVPVNDWKQSLGNRPPQVMSFDRVTEFTWDGKFWVAKPAK